MKKFVSILLTLVIMTTVTTLTAALAEDAMPWTLLENAVSVQIGRANETYSVTMYDNDAALTMLDYLSYTGMRFPTYTYEEDAGFVAQSIRGNYTRNDEMEVIDVQAGELYLFAGGQLRLYFKDVPGANITATPVGFFSDAESFITEKVQGAYTENLGDMWGVSVYFTLARTAEN